MKDRKEQKHPSVTWRGHTLNQWFGSPRKAELSTEHGYEPRLILSVFYDKDGPSHYEAQINGPCHTCYGSGKTAELALEEARTRVLKLASLLQ